MAERQTAQSRWEQDWQERQYQEVRQQLRDNQTDITECKRKIAELNSNKMRQQIAIGVIALLLGAVGTGVLMNITYEKRLTEIAERLGRAQEDIKELRRHIYAVDQRVIRLERHVLPVRKWPEDYGSQP